MFIRSLCHSYVGYGTTTTRTILDHLYATYVNNSSANLQENDAKIRAPYNTNCPIKALIDQFESAVEYAAAGNTLHTPLQAGGITYQLVFQTGMLNDDCNMWKRREPADKTWTQFKKCFATAHQELRESQATSACAGYHAANQSNLATTTASDHALVAMLTNTNSTLAAALMLSNSKLVIALQDVACLTCTIAKLRRKLGNTNPDTAPEFGWDKSHYCWTCGYACKHSSRD